MFKLSGCFLFFFLTKGLIKGKQHLKIKKENSKTTIGALFSFPPNKIWTSMDSFSDSSINTKATTEQPVGQT